MRRATGHAAHRPARAAAGAVLALGRGQDHAVAASAGGRCDLAHVGLGHHAQAAAGRGRRAGLSLHRCRRVRAHEGGRRAARVGAGARQSLRHADGAGGGSACGRRGRAVRHRLAGCAAAEGQRHGSDVVAVFILPPDGKTLERRLRTRAQDAEDVVVARRLAAAAPRSSTGASTTTSSSMPT